MPHNKRTAVNKFWPVTRKGTKYLVVPSNNLTHGIPLLIIMRELLNLVNTRKELKIILHEKKILINNKIVKETNYSLLLFDTISIPLMNKNYRIIFSETGKFNVEEINEKEINEKIVKIINKKILKKGLVQINMGDGRNIISKEKINVGDSVLINLKENKIEKILPIKKDSEVVVIEGKHRGKSGKVLKTDEKKITILSKEKELEINIKNIIVIK